MNIENLHHFRKFLLKSIASPLPLQGNPLNWREQDKKKIESQHLFLWADKFIVILFTLIVITDMFGSMLGSTNLVFSIYNNFVYFKVIYPCILLIKFNLCAMYIAISIDEKILTYLSLKLINVSILPWKPQDLGML